MSTQPTRAARSRRAPTRPARRPTAQRRGIAGGWIQRRQPKPTGAAKALAAVKGAMPASKGTSAAAAALALLGAAGLAYRQRGKGGGATGPDAQSVPPVQPVTDPAPSPRPVS